MAIIAYPDPEHQPADLKDRLARLGGLNVTRMMSHNPKLMEAYSKLGTTILLKGELDPILREAVILRIGQLCQSDYEWHQHVSVARAVGMGATMLQAIEDMQFETLPEKVALAVRIAEEIHRDTCAGKDTMRQATALFSPPELVELCIVAGYYIMTAGYLRSMEIEIEEGVPLGDSMQTDTADETGLTVHGRTVSD